MTLMTVAGVKARILNGVEALGGETVSLYEAGNRVLAEDLKARLTQPPFDASAMDGYAVRTGDVASVPVSLEGDWELGRGSWLRRQGWAHGSRPHLYRSASAGRCRNDRDPGKYPSRAGWRRSQSWKAPQRESTSARAATTSRKARRCLPAGTRLGSRHLMLAAAMNHASVAVRRKPVIAVLANGDELVPPGSAPKREPDRLVDPRGNESRHRGLGR